MYIVRTDSKNNDFVYLVTMLDSFLNHDRTQNLPTYNNIDTIKHVIVVYSDNNEPIACGAIRQYDNRAMEIKRMYVIESERGNSIASSVLSELEVWARELGINKCILETGRDMPRAIAFYKKNGYTEIDNYEPYTTNLNSICFAKNIK